MSELVLYDLPSKGHCACWSPKYASQFPHFRAARTDSYPALGRVTPTSPSSIILSNPPSQSTNHHLPPARLALNYKSLPYSTQWLEYPAVAPTLQPFGLSPNAEGSPYTIPTLRFPDNTHVMDSRAIATELERRYPTPSLHLDSEVLPEVEALVSKVMANMRGVLFSRGPYALMNEPSAEYFVRTREERFGMSLVELEKEEGGEKAWEKVKPVVGELGRVLRAKGGPFVLGKEVSYADFYIVGFLRFVQRIGEDLYERMVEMESALKTLYDASAVWLERDDH